MCRACAWTFKVTDSGAAAALGKGREESGRIADAVRANMGEPEEVTIDCTGVKTLDAFYDAVVVSLCPGFDFGRNLDAFQDVLQGGWKYEFGAPLRVRLLGSKKKLQTHVPRWSIVEEILTETANVVEWSYMSTGEEAGSDE